MAEHENATRCRLAFEALWQNADVEPTLALLADDVVWINDIGAGPWHEFHGKQGVLDICASDLDSKGLISRVSTVDRDRENIEAFWAAVGPVSAEAAQRAPS